MRLRALLPAVGIVGVAAALSACGTTITTDRTSSAQLPAASAPAADQAAAPANKVQVLKVGQIDGFAFIVINDKGRTVYRFDSDTPNSGKSTCLDACADTWQPVLAGPGADGTRIEDGIDPSLVDSIDRPEGRQLTLKGWPLYYYKNDLSLGQTAGQGRNGAWFAIAPDGSKARQGKAAAPQILKVAKINGLAPIVINDKGRTVYRFETDTPNSGKSACLDACAKTWQPVLATPGANGFKIEAGIDPTLVGWIDRPEGRQLTLKGWPLYYYKDDLKLGQIAGQGMGDTWFAIAPDGSKARQGSATQQDKAYSY
jgi:predicted lipoprotein with Yx(FWY)xxD motif